MFSLLGAIDSSIKTFFNQMTESLGFLGYLGLFAGIELLFVLIFIIKSAFSYEARLKRALNKTNEWLFANKNINENNIAQFNALIKKGPKRLVYYWQQFILYRDGGPKNYLTEENVIEKPLKTSSWANNIKNLGLLTAVWSVVALVFGFASQATQSLTFQSIAVSLVFSISVLVIGAVAIIILKGKRVLNLDDIYHLYHLFSRFLENACQDLTPFIDFNLLFTKKEIENGNPQLRQYYEDRARKAKEEFENAKNNDTNVQEYHFENVGVDGKLLLDRAMKESEEYINKKTQVLQSIAQHETEKESLRRGYENTQVDLQRKIQASKENIVKLIEQQAATTSRLEVGLLRQQQEKEVAKQAELQKEYDAEENRYNMSKDDVDKKIAELQKINDEALEKASKGMSSEYQSFLEKLMKNASKLAQANVAEEKNALVSEKEKTEDELINVQTQLKRLLDENQTLRTKLSKYEQVAGTQTPTGHYDENGNFVYEDGSYHDAKGLFHDIDGKVYDTNGNVVSKDESPEEILEKEKQQIIQNQKEQFGDVEFNSDAENVNEEIADEQTQNNSEEIASAEENEEQPVEETQNTEDVVENESEESETPAQEETLTNQETVSEEPATEEEPAEKIEETQEVEQTQPAKRRGRPRKTESEKAEVAPKKKAGRPKKSDSENQVEEQPKRKAGRPKKTEEQPTETQTKRKVGRPKKSESESKEEPKKKVGRPKKTETAEENPVAKKRGRPKKTSLSASEFGKLIDEQISKLKQEREDFKQKIDKTLNEQETTAQQIDDQQIEELKKLQDQVNSSTYSAEDIAKINAKIDEMRKQLEENK